MTEQKELGRRPVSDRRQAWEDYKIEMKVIGKKLTLKQWIVGLLGLYVGIHILVHSNSDGTKSAVQATPVAHATTSVVAEKPHCGATLAEYGAINVGMSRAQVASIIGCPGTELSRVSAGGVASVMVSWPGRGSSAAWMRPSTTTA